MSYRLSVYSQSGFKEYLLPAIDNSDYSIVIGSEMFGLRRDIELPLEILDGRWRINNMVGATISYVQSGTGEQSGGYKNDFIVDNDILLIEISEGSKVSVVVKESAEYFSIYKKYMMYEGMRFSVGRDPSNTFCYSSLGLVSGNHAVIYQRDGRAVIEDKSSNGTFVNGRRIEGKIKLKEGDCIDIFGLRLVYFSPFLAVSTAIDNLITNDEDLETFELPALSEGQDRDTEIQTPERKSLRPIEKKFFHRAPRNIPKIETEPVEIEAPPAPKELNKQPLFLTIGPSLTMAIPMLLGVSLAIYSTRMNGNNASAFMYTGLVTAVGSAIIGATWAAVNLRHNTRKNKEEELKRFESYGEYLIKCANEIKEKYRNNTQAMKEMYPSAEECSSYSDRTHALWNRNARHEDFLHQRLGTGAVPFQVDITIPKEKFSLINDNLAEKPRLIKESYKYLQNVPVCVDLFEHKLVGLVGGAGKSGCYPIVYDLTTQIAANNCYTDVKMVFIYNEAKHIDNPIWGFAKWFPHTWSEDKKVRYVAGDKQDASDVFYEIARALRIRSESSQNKSFDKKEVSKPYYILFLEDMSFIEGELISKYIFDNSEDYGLTTIVMADSYEELPNECEYLIENTASFQGMYYVTDGMDDRRKIKFDDVALENVEAFSRRLSTIEVKEEEVSGEIPNVLSFFEMYGVSRPEQLGVVERWRKNRTYESMRVLVGQKTGGSGCYLDVHEKYHGPHGLVAGTTGSGKSETLQTYMLSLALNFSPDDIGFFIIDYKGGGMANLFDGLPHVMGQISNLSGNQVRRAMVSIKSENVRRQRIFNEHGVNNINLYTRLYKNNEASIPVPHMFIIIDEFAELKREEPEFMQELISVAQVGRSLGVHLILATQKPSGTVDDNIWSNSKFRLCLRVQDRQDSMDMLHKPDAAYITQAGRCYLQVGNDELYELFQSAWSGATYDEQMGSVDTDIAKMLSINGRAALIGSFAQVRMTEEIKRNWLINMLGIIDQASIKSGCNVTDCIEDSELCQSVAKETMGIIISRGIDYGDSEYNLKRLEDLVYCYGQSKTVSINVDSNERIEAIEKIALLSGKKLPEIKEKTQLDAVVEHLANVAHDTGYSSSFKLWLPVLPKHLYLDELEGYSGNAFDGNRWPERSAAFTLNTLIGMLDDPQNQAQPTLSLNFAAGGNHAVLGTVVSGKSTFLLTYLYSLINRYSPDALNLYVLDYSSKMLGALESAPHVGGMMFEDDGEKVSKFFNMLSGILEERKKVFKGGSYAQYIRANGLTLPAIVVTIDNVGSFRNKTNTAYDDLLMTLLKEGVNYGIYFLVSASGFSMNEIPMRMGENFRTTICLEMSDKFAYTDALRTLHIDVYPEENVKGRGIIKSGDNILEFQTALPIEAEDDYKMSELIDGRCKEMRSAWTGTVARRIPEIPEKPVWNEYALLPEVQTALQTGIRMPIGYDRKDASIYGIDLSRTYCYVISGKARTGKSNMLRIAIKSAAMMGGRIAVIDFGGDLRQVTESVDGKYITNVEEMRNFFQDIVPTFKERNATKKELSATGRSSEEIYHEMQKFEKLFIFIWDLPEFLSKADNPGEDIESMTPFLNNIIEKGAMHNVFWFAAFNQDDRAKAVGYDVYKQFIKDGIGIHFGGKVDDQQVLAFDHLPYSDRSKSVKPGIGMLPTHDEDDTNIVVVPLYKAE